MNQSRKPKEFVSVIVILRPLPIYRRLLFLELP